MHDQRGDQELGSCYTMKDLHTREAEFHTGSLAVAFFHLCNDLDLHDSVHKWGHIVLAGWLNTH